jgi:hypothetical protein
MMLAHQFVTTASEATPIRGGKIDCGSHPALDDHRNTCQCEAGSLHHPEDGALRFDTSNVAWSVYRAPR